MRPETALVLALFPAVVGGLPAPDEPLPPVTVLVTRVEGRAIAEAPDGRFLELRPGRVLPGDWRLAVPAGATVALVCSNDRRVHLEGGRTGAATRGRPSSGEGTPCASGEPLLPGTYRALARGDRDLAMERSREVRLRVLQVRTRGSEEDDPRIPVLLEPRETSVTDPRPQIRWTRVPGAEEYVLELVGPSAWTERLRAGAVSCVVEPHPPGEREVCSAPWPASAPALAPAASYFLTAGARTGIATPIRKGEPRSLRLLAAGTTGLAASLGALRELGLPAAEEELRAAVLLAELGLRADASAALRRSLREAPSPRAYLLQGTLELELLLPRAALHNFREAARLAGGAPDLLAEAEAGVEASRRLLGEAVETAAAEDSDPILLEVGRLMEEIQRDMESFRLADALRRVDAALSLVEGRGYDATEAALRGYRGALLSSLQEHEAALPDLRQLTDVLAAEAERRKTPEAPDLTPLIDFLPELFLSMASGEWGAGAERLQELGRDYGDQLPPQLRPLLELLSLIQEEKAAEAAGLCREMRSGEVLGIEHPPPEISGLLDMMCTTLDFLAAMPEEGPGDPSEVTTLFEAAGKSLESQHGPLREPLELLLGQVMTLPEAADRPEVWPSGDQLRPALEALQTVISQAAPTGLRAGLDGLWSPLALLTVMIRSEAGDAAGSFELAEELRARELLDRLADAQVATGEGGEAAVRITSLRARREDLEGRFAELLARDPTSDQAAGLQEDLTRVRRELDAEVHRLALGRPETPRGALLTLQEIQAALDEETTLVAFLAFAPMGDDVLAWVVTRNEVHRVPLPVETRALEGEVRLFVQTLRRREPTADLAGSLHERLWMPLREHVRTRRVLLIPHGPLQELPFAALRDPETGRWLVEDATLLHAPSATVWARLVARSTSADAPPLVLGDPEGNLPAAAREARAVAALWGVRPLLGGEATEEALRRRAAGAPLVHVAAHGVVSPEDPLFTRLRLAPSGVDASDPLRDGRLELHEVMTGLDLAGTGLVVLPACHTGEGPRTRGDEVTNLARAFLLAGARSAVTTAWAVDDDSTAALMEDFHRRLAVGVEAAEALRLAQETALASPDRAHPWHWAGFSLHGAGGAVVEPTDAE